MIKNKKTKILTSNILRLDLDLKSKHSAIKLLSERLEFLDRKNFILLEDIKMIQLNYKSTYGAKIILNDTYQISHIFLLQSLLGSDYRKEVLAMLNFYKYNMYYPDRLFDIKKYKTGEIKVSTKEEVLNLIKKRINSFRQKKKLKYENDI